jgi:hypothetical protein
MAMSRTRAILSGLVLAAVALGGVSACMPVPPADDNGEISFVRQAVPTLLGRKAKGADEVELLADISQLLGREAVVRLLMEQPEFVAHWTDVLIDDLHVQREGPRLQEAACFGNPLRVDAQGQPVLDHGDLATFVRDNPVTATAPGGAFNMSDLVRSTVELDDLSPLYRAYPFPLTDKRPFGTEAEQRAGIGDAFNHIFLNRQMECLQCHNSKFSTTNLDPQWLRTHALPMALEDAVFACTFCDPVADKAKTNAVFRSQFGALQPWGMHPACGQFDTTLSADAITGFFAGATGTQIGLVDVAGRFKSGSDTLKTSGLQRLPPLSGETLPQVAGDTGYAFMVAAMISQNVWEELTGEKLTIANYYPRNPDQMSALWNLTEFNFVPSGWSLKDLIVRIMMSRYTNRKAPSVGGGTTPYLLPMLFDPWVQNDPREAPETDPGHDPSQDPDRHKNSIGELVHRYSPRSLLYSIHAALNWPPPRRLFSTLNFIANYTETDYPTADLQKAIGQYVSDAQQGTKGVDFQGLLGWETQFGTCQKPANVTTDWIDQLVASIPAFDAANPAFPLTVADVVSTMKDWLIQEPTLSATTPQETPVGVTEITALFDHFGVPLNTTAGAVPDLAQKLRALCGVLVETPHFMLAGIVPDAGFAVPRHRVCNGLPCTYAEICQVYRASLATLGKYIDCGARAVTMGSAPLPWVVVVDDFCPRGRCGFLPWPGITPCVRFAKLCPLPDMPPPCDPRCLGPHCCGDPPFDPRRAGVFLAYAEGARVNVAREVRVRHLGEADFVPLKEGDVLRLGDIVEVPPGAHFEASGDLGTFRTPKEGMISKKTALHRPIDRELIEAVEHGKLASVDALLGKGGDVDAADRFGETLLMKGARAGNTDLMKLLLRYGARLELEDSSGMSALDWAVASRQPGSLLLLRERGAGLKRPDRGPAVPPRVEEPWLFMVTGPSLLKAKPAGAEPRISARQALELNAAGKMGTQGLDVREIQEFWKKSGFHYRGQAGELRTPREAEAAAKRYMDEVFRKRGH